MARKSLIRSKFFPYHVTARTNNKEWFKVPIPRVYEIFTTWINWSHLIYGSLTHHFTLMNNHFHWTLSTPGKDLGFVMNIVLTQVSLELNELTRRQNHIFGARYWWSIISKARYYLHVIKYGYRDPVEAGICSNALDYPFSTLSYRWGTAQSHIWCWSHPFDQEDFLLSSEFIDWLNTPTPEQEDLETQKAMDRKIFQYSRITRTKRFIPSPIPCQKVDD